MIRKPVFINKEMKFKGIISNVTHATFNTETGLFNAEIVDHADGVCIAATHDNENFYFINQYRYGSQEIMDEFPAGIVDPGEEPLEAAYRELKEEIGYDARELISLGKIHPSPGYLNEVVHLYYATNLKHVGQSLDEHEVLSVSLRSLESIIEDIESNVITDAKTIVLAYKVQKYIKKATL